MLIQFLIICPLVFLGGFVDAIAGGGGLITLPAYLIAGLPVHNAIGTNKLSSCMGTTLTTIKYGKKGYIPWKLAPFCVVMAFAGSSLGANIALFVSDLYFKIILLFVLPLTAWYVTRKKALQPSENPYGFIKTLLFAMAIAFVIGMYDGFYGPGTGTFVILLLVGLAHMDVTKANGLSKAINLSTNVAALTVYCLNGKVLLLVGFTAGLFNLAGNYLGASLFEKGGAKSMKPVMISVLVIFFIKVLYELAQTIM